VAEALGLPASQVYKTLVVVRERGKPLLVMIPGDRELDLKRLAKAIGEKKLRMATHKEAESLTGLQVGGISALALLNRRFEVYIDRAATKLERVLVSAGRRGIERPHPRDQGPGDRGSKRYRELGTGRNRPWSTNRGICAL